MIGELLDIAKFVLGFLPWILFLFLPTDGWDALRRASFQKGLFSSEMRPFLFPRSLAERGNEEV